MNKSNVSKLISSTKKVLTEHSPEILTGVGIAGMITTSVLAVRATPKALKLVEAKKHEEDKDVLTPLETIQATWKCYIPAAVTCAASTACLIGASSVNLRRNAALATAYKLSETALSEYKEQTLAAVGEKKEKIIREKVTEEKIKKNPVSKNEVIVTANGTSLCYDPLSGRYFNSSRDMINRVVNEMNKRMIDDMYVSLNEFYGELGLDHIELGDDLGWCTDKGLIEVDFDAHLADDGTPCLVLVYRVAPKYGYDRFA